VGSGSARWLGGCCYRGPLEAGGACLTRGLCGAVPTKSTSSSAFPKLRSGSEDPERNEAVAQSDFVQSTIAVVVTLPFLAALGRFSESVV
jgi:hypothetical protein